MLSMCRLWAMSYPWMPLTQVDAPGHFAYFGLSPNLYLCFSVLRMFPFPPLKRW